MRTLFDKVAMLFSAHIQDRLDERHQTDRPIGFEDRLRQAVLELLQVEAQAIQVGAQIQAAELDTTRWKQQSILLDEAINQFLLRGEETRARQALQELQRLQQNLHREQTRHRHLRIEHNRLLAMQDKLEVKLALMGLDRPTLDEYLRRFRHQRQSSSHSQTWRVVDPHEM